MTETREYIGFGDVEKFLVKSYKRITGGREFDIDKYGPYIDAVRAVLVPSLEKQILFFLERFVYNENFQQSSCQPHLNRYKESMLTAYAKYNEIGTSIEAIKDSLSLDYLVDFFGQSLLNNTRLVRIGDHLDAMGIEKNFLGYVNVLNYINEKDFWVCSSSSSSSSKPYDSVCSDVNEEQDSHVAVCSRGHKRPKKRAATHINRKHSKLEGLAQLSPEGSFEVAERLHDSSNSSEQLKQTFGSNCDNLRQSSLTKHHRSNQTTDRKNENLAVIIKRINSAGTKSGENERQGNSEVKTSLSLPCKAEQLICKLEGINPSSTNSSCSSVQKKFQTKLYNVCSCLNDLLSKMDRKMINTIYLICEIRTDYLNFKLKQSPASKCNSNLFSARVMTCEGLYNRYEIRKNDSRQKLKYQNSRATQAACRTRNVALAVCEDFNANKNKTLASDEESTSVEISFTTCENGENDQQNRANELSGEPQGLQASILRDSLSISDIVQKLQLSPFHLEETEQSFRIRSKIKDIVRSIIICTGENSPPGQVDGQSIFIQATVSMSSFPEINHDTVSPIESKFSEALSAPEIVSEIILENSGDYKNCNVCAEPEEYGIKVHKKFATPESCSGADCRGTRCRESGNRNKVPQKFQAPHSSGESSKLTNEKKNKICTSSGKLVRSKEFSGSHGRSFVENNKVESIACKISKAIARTKSTDNVLAGDENDYDIDVTVEIEDSSVSSDSISRHTHLLPSMKSVKLGTCQKYLMKNDLKSTSSSSSSSLSEIVMRHNFTTMNKSMKSSYSSSRSSAISGKSYDRIKYLIRDKVCKKLSESDSCQPNSSKTIVSSGKYYLSIPSSKASRIRLRRGISESSSSTSRESSHCRGRIRRILSSDKESVFSKSSDCYCADSENDTETSRAATFDRNSTYGCVDDRLANKYLSETFDDFADESGDSPRCSHVDSQLSYEKFSNDEEQWKSRCSDCEICTERTDPKICQRLTTGDDEPTNGGRSKKEKCFTTFVLRRREITVPKTPRLKDYERFDDIPRICRVSGWSTCAVRSSSSIDCGEIYQAKNNDRTGVRRNRGDSRRYRSFKFDPIDMIEKYKKRFKNIDRSLRAKVQHYIGICKNVKRNFQRQICLDDVCEASRSSIPSNDYRGHKYSGACFTG